MADWRCPWDGCTRPDDEGYHSLALAVEHDRRACYCSPHADEHLPACTYRGIDPSLHVERPKKMRDGKTYCACGRPWPCLFAQLTVREASSNDSGSDA